MQSSQKPVIWTVIIATVVLLLGAYMMSNSVKNAMPETPDVPTAAEVAALVVIPETVIPEQYVTGPQVTDTKKEVAYQLALDEMDDDDFREAVMDEINSDIGNGYRYIDDEDDMVFVVKDLDEDETEVDLRGSEGARVTLEFVVYFLEDGENDECGKARMQVQFRVSDLDRDNDYEDAEVTDTNYLRLETRNEPRDSYCSRF